jgi:anaerobic selenocysteine-containing dehydrogenase
MGYHPLVRHPFTAGAPPLLPTSDTTTDDVLEWLSSGSRIPFAEVKARGRGALYPEPEVRVQAKEPGWSGRLQLAHSLMLADLTALAAAVGQPAQTTEAPFSLVCRREAFVYNTSCGNTPATHHGRPYNPAHMHPADLSELGVEPGDLVEISSEVGAIPAVVADDDTLRRGLVSMMFGFGEGAERDAEVRQIGSNPNRLISNDQIFDRYTGQPRMSNVPVQVRRLTSAGE